MNNQVSNALPPATFITGAQLRGSALPVGIVSGTTLGLPSTGILDCSGYNTLSLFITLSGIAGGNTLAAKLITIDPQAFTPVASNLGDVTLIAAAAVDGSYAATIYLPAYYSTLVGLVAPFYLMNLNLTYGGGGADTVQVDALKLWLTNA